MSGFNYCSDDWPDSILAGGYDEDFYVRLEATGFMARPHKFNVYVRRRLPDKTLQHVKRWKNLLPEIDEIGYAFGEGEAIIDFEVLFGRNSGKKKKGIRTTIWFERMPTVEKKIHYDKTPFSRRNYANTTTKWR
jgi:hypothetical protein